jgi:hypothetical protein
MLRDVLTSLEGVATWPCDEINFVWKHGNLSHPGDDLVPDQILPRTRHFVTAQFDSMARESGAAFIVEKTCANSLRIPFVDALVPEAKYILLVRDGRDAVASTIERWQNPQAGFSYLWQKFRFVAPGDRFKVLTGAVGKRLLPSRNRGKAAWDSWGPMFPELRDAREGGRSLAEICALQYAHCVARATHDLRTIDSSRRLMVRYEDFVHHPGDELNRVLDFLQVSCSEAQVNLAIEDVHPSSVGNASRGLDGPALTTIDAVLARHPVDLTGLI